MKPESEVGSAQCGVAVAPVGDLEEDHWTLWVFLSCIKTVFTCVRCIVGTFCVMVQMRKWPCCLAMKAKVSRLLRSQASKKMQNIKDWL